MCEFTIMVFVVTSRYAVFISAYPHLSYEFDFNPWRNVLNELYMIELHPNGIKFVSNSLQVYDFSCDTQFSLVN
jgi:hypothetical protein